MALEERPQEETIETPGSGDFLVTTWSSKRILVLQGNEVVRQAIINVLQGCGYLPLEASTTEEASEHFRRGTKVDVLVCDIVTEEETGPGLVARFRRYGPLRAIFLSRHASRLGGETSPADPCRCVLKIPFGTSEFLAALRETLGRCSD